MNSVLFTGACTALVTPFLDHAVNYPMLEQLLRRQIDAGIEAIVICGTTGEAPTLSDDEKLELFRRSKAYVGDSCKIIAGTGSNNTERTIQLSIRAQKAGADGLLIVSPYYNKATSDGLYAHYLAVSQSVDVPIIVYNVPSRTGLDIPVSGYKILAEIPNITGIKEASSDITKTIKIQSKCGNRLTLWSGNDDMTVPMISLGGKGVISVLSNIFPLETQTMAKAALAGDFDTAAAMQIQFQPIIETLFSEVNPVPIKAAMKLMGYDCGECRLPLGKMSKDKLSELERKLYSTFCIERYGFNVRI